MKNKQKLWKYNLKNMKNIFSTHENNFEKFGFTKYATDKGRYYYYKDNGANVLAVGHLDSVQSYTHFVTKDNKVLSPVVDDRLGVYVIMDLLPKFGLKYDILLTTEEETGSSTAELFETVKKYNWMFEFDRGGDDVVLYEYQTLKYEEMLEEEGFEVGFGIFSDICELEHLGCMGMNIGTGYYDYHSFHAWADLRELRTMVDLFVKFFHKHKNTHFPHTERAYKFSSGNYGYGGDYWNENKGKKGIQTAIYEEVCVVCGEFLWTDFENDAEMCYKCVEIYQPELREPDHCELCGCKVTKGHTYCDYCGDNLFKEYRGDIKKTERGIDDISGPQIVD